MNGNADSDLRARLDRALRENARLTHELAAMVRLAERRRALGVNRTNLALLGTDLAARARAALRAARDKTPRLSPKARAALQARLIRHPRLYRAARRMARATGLYR